ncbi:hypothetical protein ASG23_13685 [Cellulomonas sp. Leaf395]|nr:hypothetical protein ASG23_13685 [Cellulomonas sp. Leaf395]
MLVVGSANVSRSRAAERLMRARVGQDEGIEVSSAGTRAALGEPVVEPFDELLTAVGAYTDGRSARQLSTETVHSADLVLTATREERAAVVRLVPAAVGRTFTLREFARVAASLGPSSLPEGDLAARLSALVRAAPPLRGPTAPTVAADDDVLDPSGMGPAAFERSFVQVQAAVDSIVRTVRPTLADGDPPLPEPYAPPARRSRGLRNVALLALASLVGLVVVGTVGAFVAIGLLDDRVERFPDPFANLSSRPAPFVPTTPGGALPVTILVLGSTDDVRTDDPDAWATAAAQTDVVMLAHVSADRSHAHVIAMPPDLWVEVPGEVPGTLRAAFAEGGPPGAVQAVERLTNVRLDHVALADSETFARVTQSLGGVTLPLESNLVIGGRVVATAGERRLTGEQALVWVRGAVDDDLGRAQRSAVWLLAILDRMGDGDVRHNPLTWLRLLGVITASVAVDEGFDRSEMVGLLASVRTLGPGEVDVLPVPTVLAAGETGALLVPDAAPFSTLMDSLRTDTLGAHLDGG